MTAHPLSAHPLVAGVRALLAEAGSLGELDPAYLRDEERQELLMLLPAVETLVSRLSMQFLHSCHGVADADGFRDVANWAARRTRQAAGPLRADIKLAASLQERWQQTGAAVASAEINMGQARAITHALDALVDADAELRHDGAQGVPSEVFLQAEKKLLSLAEEFGPRELRRLGAGILAVVAPDVADRHEQAALERAERRAATTTRLTLRRRGDGTVDLHARISEAAATRLEHLIDAFASPRTGGNGQPARGFGVTDPATGRRLPAERIRGEAFAALLEAVDPGALPSYGGGATQIVVTISLEALQTGLGQGTLHDGTPISVGQTRRLACQAGILPAVLDGESEVVDFGRSRRFFSLAQQRRHALKHPTCQAEGCDVPAAACEAHHAEPWSRGGPTDAKFLENFCVHHHHRVHDPAFHTIRKPNGKATFRKIRR